MKKKWICTGIITALVIASLIGLYFNFLTLDFSPVRDELPGNVQESFDAVTEILGAKNGAFGITGSAIMRSLARHKELSEKGEIVSAVAGGIQKLVLVPYIMILVCLILGIFHKVGTYIAGITSALAGLIFSLLSTLIIFPKTILEQIPKDTLDTLNTAGKLADLFLGENVFSDTIQKADRLADGLIRTWVFHSTGPGWWLMTAVLLLLLIVFVIGLVFHIQDKGESAETSLRNSLDDYNYYQWPYIMCEFGDLAGAQIDMPSGEQIVIGRDFTRCNVVIKEDLVEDMHCGIEFDFSKGEFQVTDYSSIGTFCEGMRLNPSEPNLFPPGVRIYLGKQQNAIVLKKGK